MSVDSPTPRLNSAGVLERRASRCSRSRRGAAARPTPRAPRGRSPSSGGSRSKVPLGAFWNVLMMCVGIPTGRGGVTDGGAASLRNGFVARSRPIVVWGPWPDRTTVSSGSGRQTRASDASNSSRSPPGRSGAADGAGEQQVPGEQHLRDVLLLGSPEGHRALGMARGVVDGDLQTGQLQHGAVGELAGRPSGSANVDRPKTGVPGASRAPSPGRRACRGRRGGCRPGCRGRRRPATTDHRVVDVAVGEQDRDRLQPVLADDSSTPATASSPGVDDHALLAGAGRHEVAVRTQAPAGNPATSTRAPHSVGDRSSRSVERLGDFPTQATGGDGPIANHWKLHSVIC